MTDKVLGNLPEYLHPYSSYFAWAGEFGSSTTSLVAA